MKAQIDGEKLKYLEFLQVAMIHAALCVVKVYGYAKENSGPLKPGVQTVEGTVKTVVGPVYDKYHDVPVEVLKFVDRKVLFFFFFSKWGLGRENGGWYCKLGN